MNKKVLFFFVWAFCVSMLFSADFSSLLKLAQDNSAFYDSDFKGSYSVVQEKPGEGKNVTEAIMYRRDKTAQWVIQIIGPAKEKGKGYLQSDGNIWFYDPADSAFTFTSAKDKFQNTNANNSDFAPQFYARDYDILSAEEVKLGKLECVCFELSAKSAATWVDYPKLKLWVTKDDGLVRKKEDYSLSGQLLRTTLIPSYQLADCDGKKYGVPVNMLIVDNLRGKKIGDKIQYERTQISISNVSFEKVKDYVYTKPFLENK